MNRYLVRRKTEEVWIWSELLARRGDLEEVYAESPKQALGKPATLDPRRVSIADIEGLPKQDLIVFGRIKLGLDLNEEMPLPDMQDKVKEALLIAPPGAVRATKEVGPFADPQQALRHPGDRIVAPAKATAQANTAQQAAVPVAKTG